MAGVSFAPAGLAAALLMFGASAAQAVDGDCAGVYETRARGAGTGRWYLGRETAPVMGHQGAAWLERPEREAEERPSRLIEALGLKPGDRVADVGAGTGYFALRIAPRIGKGRVVAVDVQPEMLALLEQRRQRAKVDNVDTMLGAIDDPKLPPASVDLVLMVDVYHEFSHPCEMMRGIVRALRPGGRVALVEYREEDLAVPILPLHKMSKAQIEREMQAAGLVLVQSFDGLPWQHLMFFRKR